MTELSDLRAYALDLQKKFAARDAVLDQMQKLYFLDWPEKSELEQKFPHMRLVLSPDGRQKIKTAVRLMTAAQPLINVPQELQTEIGPDIGNKIEKWAALVLRQSDRIRGNPLSYDVCLSGLLYDEIFITINDTKALMELGGNRAQEARYKRIHELTPFLLDVHDPHGCYVDRDRLGITAFARCVKMNSKAIISQYGDKGKAALVSGDEHNVWTLYTLEDFAVWIEGSDIPIYNEKHNLSVIPVVAHTVEGSSSLFTSVEAQREPFLYTLWKSGLWNMENLSLSAQATNLASALWPQLKFVSATRNAPEIDLSVPWGVFHLEPGEDLNTWNKNLLDPALIQMWQTASALANQATLYEQVAGAPLGPGASFSETALLHQAGRLPLVAIQRKAGWAIGDALRIAALLYKDMGVNDKPYGFLAAKDVPDNLELEVSLDIALPQDRLQLAGIFRQLEGKLPTAWLMENILNIRNPEEMIKRTYDDRATEAYFMAYLQKIMAEQMQPQQPSLPPELTMLAKNGGQPPMDQTETEL